MVDRLGSAEAAVEQLPDHAAAQGSRNYRPADPGTVRAEIDRGLAANAIPLVLGQTGYPTALTELSDAPPVLWARGDIDLLSSPSVAIVGARNASALGQRMAAKLAEGLGEAGFVVTSGLARGIDRAAHFAALKTGTIAVVAGGLDVIYPPQNADLVHAFDQGRALMLSEEPFGLQPLARHFPKRNRIISGLSKATVLVEAAARSGSLITARCALDQGREVMAVPGHPLDPRAEGCNRLIRDGAVLIRYAGDVVQALEVPVFPSPIKTDTSAPSDIPTPQDIDAPLPGAIAQEIMAIVSTTPMPIDAVLRHLGRPSQEVLASLTDLDLNGQIERHPGGYISLKAG
jgi:DNA processing protein